MSATKLIVGERVTVARIEHMRVDAVHDDGTVHLVSAFMTWAGPMTEALKMMRLATGLKLVKGAQQ